jgi:hypothetical protein
MREELGIADATPVFLYRYLWKSPVESELIHSFRVVHPGPFRLQPEELEDGRFWSLDEIEAHLNQQLFTPNFEFEWPKIRPYLTTE